MKRSPLGGLSRGLKDAVMHDPEFMSMTEGNPVVPTTWGDLASRLVENGDVEPDIEAICAFLMIEPEQLRDATIIFENVDQAAHYEHRCAEKQREEFRAAYGTAARSDHERFVSIVDMWKIEDGKERADVLHAEIVVDDKALSELGREEYWTAKRRLMLKVLERDALASGYRVQLTEFVSTMLSTENRDYFTNNQVVEAINDMIDTLMYLYRLDDETQASEIWISHKLIQHFLNGLYHQFTRANETQIRARWDILSKFIYTNSIYDHPLLAGNEK